MTEDNNVYSNSNPELEDKKPEGYQVLISDITWNPKSNRPYYSKRDDDQELPTQFAYDIPEGFLKSLVKKHPAAAESIGFKDAIETHCYDFLTRRFGHEVYSCSIWLPLENPSI